MNCNSNFHPAFQFSSQITYFFENDLSQSTFTMYVRAPVKVCRGISVCNDYTSTCVGGWSYSLTITRFRLTNFSGSPLIVRYMKPRSEPEIPSSSSNCQVHFPRNLVTSPCSLDTIFVTRSLE